MVKKSCLPFSSIKSSTSSIIKTSGVLCLLLASPLNYANAAGSNFGDDFIKINPSYEPAYDPIGLSIWAFILDPSVSVGSKFTDNVYAVDKNTSSDRITTVRPEFLLKSDFTRHKINIRGFAERGRYLDYTSENYDDRGINVDARIDVLDDINIPLTFSYSKLHEDRENPDVQSNINPLIYHLTEATTGLVHSGQTIACKIIASLKRFVYKNSVSTTGPIDESTRDKDILGVYANIGMTPDGILAPYIYGNYLRLDYPTLGAGGISRNADEWEGGLGTIVNFTPITRASFNVGRKNRNFSDNTFHDFQTITYGSNIIWEPLEYLSVLAEADKSIQEATFTGSSSSINTTYRISANYEFRPNIIVQPSYTMLERSYQGANAGRLQTNYTGLNIVYKMNPNIWLNASYQSTDQNKKEDAPGLRAFQKDVYGVSLKLQF